MSENELRQFIRSLSDDVRELKSWLQGDPSDPEKPGILVRLDRMERFLKLFFFVFSAGTAALMTDIVTRLMDKFIK